MIRNENLLSFCLLTETKTTERALKGLKKAQSLTLRQVKLPDTLHPTVLLSYLEKGKNHFKKIIKHNKTEDQWAKHLP